MSSREHEHRSGTSIYRQALLAAMSAYLTAPFFQNTASSSDVTKGRQHLRGSLLQYGFHQDTDIATLGLRFPFHRYQPQRNTARVFNQWLFDIQIRATTTRASCERSHHVFRAPPSVVEALGHKKTRPDKTNPRHPSRKARKIRISEQKTWIYSSPTLPPNRTSEPKRSHQHARTLALSCLTVFRVGPRLSGHGCGPTRSQWPSTVGG